MLLPFSNLQLKHWNPGATQPLILPVHVICNTPDDELHSNIAANSRRPGKWLNHQPAHDGIALLCGSGPSLADTLDDIKARQSQGATVFAMNGAARYLVDHGIIMPDYQLIIDPREMTADLVGPAKCHMFASQVHPACFDRAPDARIWHLQIDGIEDILPNYEEPFTLLGGAASVGNTALCLVYAMGFRELNCFGYDSSHRGHANHAFPQAINNGEPCAVVMFNGQDYLASLTMKLQAERFQETARLLQDEGCQVHVHGSGLLPDMWNTPPEVLQERDKYERMWSYPAYRFLSPGEDSVEDFLEIVKPSGTVVDFGCGTGRAALKIAAAGCNVRLVDFANNCRDPEAMHLPFYQLDLSEGMPFRVEYGYCTDVLEHIPSHQVITVIRNVMTSARTVFFQISTREDRAGAIINQKLHLTVQPHGWWGNLFEHLGYAVSYDQDYCGDNSQFVVSRKEN